MNYYNEIDPNAAAWLRELIEQKHIPSGHVDTRSIADVSPADLRGFTQCHFFAGIGGWDLALRLAGWPDDQPVWTGSCPCQPFSAAGKQKGTADDRHLWPEFRRLISECRPATVFGEQVASALGRDWLAGVRTDLEALGYAVGASDLGAACVGAPHIRQRLYWGASRVADPVCERRCGGAAGYKNAGDAWEPGEARWMADVQQPGLEGQPGDVDDVHQPGLDGAQAAGSVASGGGVGGLADAPGERRTGERVLLRSETGGRGEGGIPETPGRGGVGGFAYAAGTRLPWGEDGRAEREATGKGWMLESERGCDAGFWSRYDLIPCRDGKVRRVEPGTFPLAHGVSGRVGLLRGYGNAIVPQVAAAFVGAFSESLISISNP